MAAKIRNVRESAFLITFELMFSQYTADEAFALAEEAGDIAVNGKVRALVNGIVSKTDELDRVIEEYSSKRSLDRIPRINLAILRLAIYEVIYEEKVPINVTISEAINLAEKFAQNPDVAFINGILGSFARSRESTANE